MADNTYVLDLWVTGADAVSVNDDGVGNDTIKVKGVYTATIDIDLGLTTVSGVPMNAISRYYSADNRAHDLMIHGQIENAFGSNGTEFITGNELDNRLGGDQSRTGPGLSDTILGGGGNDQIYGGAGADSLRGEADDDILYGDAGDDLLDAGSGDDTVEGGAGADQLLGGGDAGDTLSYAASRRGVTVLLQAHGVTRGHGGDAKGDQISGFANVIGSAMRDRITMADKVDLPQGQANNAVYGGGGGDRIYLGGGDDGAYGGSGGDTIYGETGNDRLFGDGGADWLYGGFGQDFLTGGSGADRFVFVSAEPGAGAIEDVITDFNALEQDRIDLSAMDADPGRGGDQAYHLISGSFTGLAGEVQVTVQGDDLRIEGDRNGDAQADFSILLLGLSDVTAGDFIM